MVSNEKLAMELTRHEIDKETIKIKIFMCKKCKFFENDNCLKNRNIKECNRKGWKNRE